MGCHSAHEDGRSRTQERHQVCRGSVLGILGGCPLHGGKAKPRGRGHGGAYSQPERATTPRMFDRTSPGRGAARPRGILVETIMAGVA